MHVAFALLTLFPGRVGGSESNVRGLLDQFAAGNGPERLTVLASERVAAAYAGYARGPVALHPMPRYRTGSSDATRLLAMLAARPLGRFLAGGAPAGIDVLHHPVTVPTPRLPGTPTVTTVYDPQHHELPDFFSRAERAFRRWAYDGAARRADLVLTTSEYSRTRLVELAGISPERVEAVAMGIDHGRFTAAPDERDERLARRLGLPERFLVYPANLWPHKNHRRLIEALALARDRELGLVLTGQELGRAGELAELARGHGVGDRVRHLGYLEPADMPALLRRASAMVFPSLYEGFGSPPLEAMACGLPVASSTRGSLGEVIGDAALAIEDPESAESIAAAIDQVCAGGEQLARRGAERAARYTWEAAARAHRAAYERLIQNAAGAAPSLQPRT
ncbi:MAG: glycosyltransferase family 4 protein [Thermoleophilaceae bacterium]